MFLATARFQSPTSCVHHAQTTSPSDSLQVFPTLSLPSRATSAKSTGFTTRSRSFLPSGACSTHISTWIDFLLNCSSKSLPVHALMEAAPVALFLLFLHTSALHLASPAFTLFLSLLEHPSASPSCSPASQRNAKPDATSGVSLRSSIYTFPDPWMSLSPEFKEITSGGRLAPGAHTTSRTSPRLWPSPRQTSRHSALSTALPHLGTSGLLQVSRVARLVSPRCASLHSLGAIRSRTRSLQPRPSCPG